MHKFALLIPPPERVIAGGIFTFAAVLERLGLDYRYVTHPLAAGKDEVLCVSLLTNKEYEIETPAKRIIAGGPGVFLGAQIVGYDKDSILYVSGAANDLTRGELNEVGCTIDKGFTAEKAVIPVIPRNYAYKSQSIGVYTGTGCYYRKCIFCEMRDRIPYVNLEPDLVAYMITTMAEKYPNLDVRLSQDGPTSKFIDEVSLQIIRRTRKEANWVTYLRANQATRERCQRMAIAGCHCVMVGAEYFDDEVLSYLQKGITVSQILSAHSNIVDAGMIASLLLIDFRLRNKSIEARHKKILKDLPCWEIRISEWEGQWLPI